MLNLKDAKGVDTPGINEPKSSNAHESKLATEDERSASYCLTKAEATAYRGCAARSNYLGLDRPELQFAAKEVGRYMSNPTVNDIAALKRLGRYVKQHPRSVLEVKFQDAPTRIRIFSDANWAGCLKTRKSTQGGGVMLGQHC